MKSPAFPGRAGPITYGRIRRQRTGLILSVLTASIACRNGARDAEILFIAKVLTPEGQFTAGV